MPELGLECYVCVSKIWFYRGGWEFSLTDSIQLMDTVFAPNNLITDLLVL